MAPISWIPKFSIEPPKTKQCTLSYPSPNVVLLTLNRPKDLNCINEAGHFELDDVWEWLDQEPALSVGIITGEGRAFCAGADLKGTNIISYCTIRTVSLEGSLRRGSYSES
jgi:1,4-dihydroxy-2-naphthoyl-CoA synthase